LVDFLHRSIARGRRVVNDGFDVFHLDVDDRLRGMSGSDGSRSGSWNDRNRRRKVEVCESFSGSGGGGRARRKRRTSRWLW
jgi:hypothetical protein